VLDNEKTWKISGKSPMPEKVQCPSTIMQESHRVLTARNSTGYQTVSAHTSAVVHLFVTRGGLAGKRWTVLFLREDFI
jgi:hypothetical protein